MPRPSVPDGGTVTQTQCSFNSCASTFAYNTDQRLQSVTNPESGTTSYTYNADGTLATKTDAKGQVITNYYDAQGRLIQVKNGIISLRTLTYDSNGYGTYLNGRLASVSATRRLRVSSLDKIVCSGRPEVAVRYRIHHRLSYRFFIKSGDIPTEESVRVRKHFIEQVDEFLQAVMPEE